MSNYLFLIFLFIAISISNFVSAEIKQGKWSFQIDSNYCFIGSSPIESILPEGKKRGDPYILVYRINQNPEAIIQINSGYPYKSEEPVSVIIDNTNYEFFSEEDSAWTNHDAKIISAMKKGLELNVVGISSRGTKTIDKYTLNDYGLDHENFTE